MSEDLTQGRISSVLISFTMPLILSGILQQMYSWADAFIVGNVEGETALGGIGAVNAIGNLFIMIIMGLTTGLSVLAARQFGMGRKDDLRAILSTFSIVLTLIFILICGLCIPFVSQIVQLLDTPTVLFATARTYLLIVLAGFPFLALYNIFAAVLRGAGDSKAALWAVAVSSLVNVVLDLVLVAAFRFGVAGAAFATSLSQMAMAVFMAWYAFSRYPYLRFIKRNPLINREIFIEGMKLSIPPAIQSAIHCGGNLILQRFMNGFGEQTVAAITTAYRVDSVILLPVIQFGSGCSAVTAQNLGAGKDERARQVLKTGVVLNAILSLCLTGVVLLFGRSLISMFGLEADSAAIGSLFFSTIASFYVVFGMVMACRGFLEGSSDMTIASSIAIIGLLVRIASSYGLVKLFGRMVIAWAEAICWCVQLFLFAWRALMVSRRMKKESYVHLKA